MVIQFPLTNSECSKITEITYKTHNLLTKAVNVLMDAAYLQVKSCKNGRQDIVVRINGIINEYFEIDKTITKMENEVLQNLMESDIDYAVKGEQIWGYSRIFDRLHRHNKRVMNIAQSAMFGLPSVES